MEGNRSLRRPAGSAFVAGAIGVAISSLVAALVLSSACSPGETLMAPPPNGPPVVGPIVLAVSPPTLRNLRVITSIEEPDGDPVSWVVEMTQSPPGSTVTIVPANGTGASVDSGVTLSTGGIYTVRVTASDGRGGTAAAQRQFEVPL